MKIMVPIREAIAQLVQTVTSPPPMNGGAVFGGAGGVLAVIFATGAPRLWVVLWVVMLTDLGSGLLRALVIPGQRVNGPIFLGGFLGKLLLLLLIPAAGALDEVASMAPEHIAAISNVLPATSLVMVALIMREVASIVQNVKEAKGDGAFLAIFTRALGVERITTNKE